MSENDQKQPRATVKRKAPADIKPLTAEEIFDEKYKDIGTVSSKGRLNINPKLTSAARELYKADPQSVEVHYSLVEVTIYLALRGMKDPTKTADKSKVELTYDKKTGASSQLHLRNALRKFGIEVPNGRVYHVPATVEDVEEYGPCIILDVRERDFVASGRKGKDPNQGEEQKPKTEAAPAAAEKPNGEK